MNKRQLYESIMEHVAKEVKKVLNEGEAIYEPGILDPEEGRNALKKKEVNYKRNNSSNELQKMLPNPKNITHAFIKHALETYKNSGLKYNPYLDGSEFRDLIYRCLYLEGDRANLNWIDTSYVTDMSYLFTGKVENSASHFMGSVSDWDVSNVTNMKGLFHACHYFNGDLSKWDTSKVKDMSYMFDGAFEFNQDISSWNVSNVNNIEKIFARCLIDEKNKPTFNSKLLDVNYYYNITPSKVDEKFIKYALKNYEKTGKQYNPHLDNEDFYNFIKKCIKIQGNKANLNWIDTSYVISMESLFKASEFNGDISKWDVSHVKYMDGMFYYSIFNMDISSWDVSNVTDMSYMFEYSEFNGDISKWNVSNVKDMSYMFYESKFNGDISHWDVSKVIAARDIVDNSSKMKLPTFRKLRRYEWR